MPTLTERVRTDLTASMKARDALKTSTLRMLQSALKNEQIDKGRELSDEEAAAIIRRGVKQRQDSIEQFTKGNRPELAQKEEVELEILNSYLPRQLSDEDVEQVVRAAISQVGASSRKDSGAVMKAVMATHKGLVDGKKVQEIVAKLLP